MSKMPRISVLHPVLHSCTGERVSDPEKEKKRKEKEKMIHNVVFDIGGVLADFKLKEFLMEKGFDGPMIRRLLKASLMTPYWGQFERGELTEEETFQRFISLDPENEDNLRKAFSNVEGMLTIRDFAIPLVKALKEAGYGVYYLSNYSPKAYAECGSSLAFMPYMDGGIVSFKVGRTKPDPEMYRIFLDEYKLVPEECVFVDDTPENVEEAERAGFQGIVFQDLKGLLDRLKELQVSISETKIPTA